ncbi:hypothetical protein ABGB17_02565 [Sphaerisporangium sp. B11E5]|uniref:hypothetical protein n=1 Tax=Sphaerisporangium sp. B11E5 TaxID=3153563 RepID=UPI00325F9467
MAERITVGLVPRVAEQLQKLQESTGLSKTDLVNRAISVYEFLETEAAQGNDVMVRKHDTGETLIIKIL